MAMANCALLAQMANSCREKKQVKFCQTNEQN